MPEFSSEFNVTCGKCGADLNANCTEIAGAHRNLPSITVEPCEICLDEARNEGYEDRKDEEV